MKGVDDVGYEPLTITYTNDSSPLPTLRNGDCMGQKEFHRLYELMPEGFRAELINGVVYVSEPLALPHGTQHLILGSVFTAYWASTKGTEVGDNVSVILGPKDEVQPDLFMRIQPDFGGQSKTTDDLLIKGAPELVAEISYSTRSMDLHFKKERYKRCGVREYIVVSLRPADLHWFDLQSGQKLEPKREFIYSSRLFPGFWLNSDALLKDDYHRSMATLNMGLASPEHAAFLNQLRIID